MIKYARSNLARENVSAELMTVDCQDLQFQTERFDLLVCRNLTWTLDDPVKAYAEWYRVLHPGGKLLIFDACWYLHLFEEDLRTA